jgi:hypothetical protein
MARVRNQRPTNVDYYRRNREQELFRVKARQAGTRDMLREWREVPCADCGNRYEPHQMDFDHRDPSAKCFNLTAGRAALRSRERLRDEAAKCDVVCVNCHRIRTQSLWNGRPRKGKYTTPAGWRRMVLWQQRRDFIDSLRARPCADCKNGFPTVVMEFDHRDPGTKSYTVSRMVMFATFDEIRTEAAKCDIVCANCHRMRTYRQRHTLERE